MALIETLAAALLTKYLYSAVAGLRATMSRYSRSDGSDTPHDVSGR